MWAGWKGVMVVTGVGWLERSYGSNWCGLDGKELWWLLW